MTTPRRRAVSRSSPRHQAWPGSEAPLGATWDGEGTNFAVYSASAEGVDVVLYDESGARPRHINSRSAPTLSGTVMSTRSVPVSATAFASMAVRPTPRAPPQPAQVAARPIRAGHRGKVQARARTLRVLVRRRRPRSDPLDSAASMPRSVVVDKGSPGARIAGRTRMG